MGAFNQKGKPHHRLHLLAWFGGNAPSGVFVQNVVTGTFRKRLLK